ncbi:MAG: hypothetical protein ACI9XU_001048 [Arenicella sp.]|jgi:hypothetical protein
MRAIFLTIIVPITLFSFPKNLLAEQHAAKENEKPIEYNFGYQYQIQSKILSKERQLLIYVPEEYQKSAAKFPVVYMLEDNIHDKNATISAEKIQKTGSMPARIIVVITDKKGTTKVTITCASLIEKCNILSPKTSE